MKLQIEELNQDFEKFSKEWSNTPEYNSYIYNYFLEKVNNIKILDNHDTIVAKHSMGFGERAFRYLWAIVFSQIPKKGRFLEIGVYKGSILSLSQSISNELLLDLKIFGVTPLNSTGDKFSNYREDDYRKSISYLFTLLDLTEDNLNIIEGLSTSENVKNKLQNMEMFDVIYIDGGHNYDTVISDIELCDKILKPNGLLIMDDASSKLNFSNHSGFLGHLDVWLAIEDTISKNNNYQHLFACGHNRVWRKI